MARTKHMGKRMGQRGIDNELVALALALGNKMDRGDVEKRVLNRKGIDVCVERLNLLRKQLLKLRDKGGIVVVSGEDGVEITAYRVDSFRRSGRAA